MLWGSTLHELLKKIPTHAWITILLVVLLGSLMIVGNALNFAFLLVWMMPAVMATLISISVTISAQQKRPRWLAYILAGLLWLVTLLMYLPFPPCFFEIEGGSCDALGIGLSVVFLSPIYGIIFALWIIFLIWVWKRK